MSIGAKLDSIYNDLSSNVTHIYERPDLQLAMDLVYHSVLQFNFGGSLLQKGYVEGLCIGDTRCGKTETARSLIRHYGVGAFACGEGATFAGLVGGLEQHNGRWLTRWGKIPLNHRRLLVIDEMAGISEEDMANMSQIRSSGVAELTKINSERTNAKTRLMWFSNPRQKRTVGSFGFGPELIQDVVGKPEDIARFDFIIIVAFDDVNDSKMNAVNRDAVPHVYTPALCHDLIMWAWTRKPEDVIFMPGTREACYEFARKMYTKYSNECPIVNASEQKIKLAKLAVALACRLFSTDDGQRVLVYPEHVEFIHDWLNQQYDKSSFQYDQWSKRRMADVSIENVDDLKKLLLKFGKHALLKLLEHGSIFPSTIEDTLGVHRDVAKTYLSSLIKSNALTKLSNYYVKTPAFIKFLKEFIRTTDFDIKEKEEF